MSRFEALPGTVRGLTGAYLEAVDEALPGFVAGLYVVGSAALGAWESGRSDVDTVVLASRVPTASDLAALREVHAVMSGGPDLDGVYLSPGDGWPADARVLPHVVGGEFHADRPCGELNPVLWLTLQRCGIPVRGPAVGELGVRVDADELRAYNLDNLRTYWQAQAARIRRYVADLPPTAPVDATFATWTILGPARLHCTLATGDVISKSAAGGYIAEHFRDHAPLAGRATRWRAGELCTFTARDLAAAAALADLVAGDAWRRWG